MERIFIVVKGQEADAERAAREHGLELSILGHSSNFTEVYCECPLSDMPRVIDWYAKDAGWAGTFESGSCLWYAKRK